MPGERSALATPFIIFGSGKARARNDARYRPPPLDKDRQKPPSDGEGGARRDAGCAARCATPRKPTNRRHGSRKRLGDACRRNGERNARRNARRNVVRRRTRPPGRTDSGAGTAPEANPNPAAKRPLEAALRPKPKPPPAGASRPKARAPANRPRRSLKPRRKGPQRRPPKHPPPRRRRHPPPNPSRPGLRHADRTRGHDPERPPPKARPPKGPRTRKATKKARASSCPPAGAVPPSAGSAAAGSRNRHEPPGTPHRLDGDRPRRNAGGRRSAPRPHRAAAARAATTGGNEGKRLRPSGARRRERRRLRRGLASCDGAALSRREPTRSSGRCGARRAGCRGRRRCERGRQRSHRRRQDRCLPRRDRRPAAPPAWRAGGGGAGVGLSGFLAFATAAGARRAARDAPAEARLPAVAHGVLRADSRATRLGPRPDRRPGGPRAGPPHWKSLRSTPKGAKR